MSPNPPVDHADVGIDIGKRRIAYGWPAWGLAGSFDLGSKPGRRDHELRLMQDWLIGYLPEGVQLWIDQAYAGNGAVATAQALQETIAAVLTAQDWAHAPQIVHQATWKAKVLGNHMAGKEEIRVWLAEHYPRLYDKCSTEDEIDAMVIGIYGAGRTRGEILPPEPKKRPRTRKARA